MVIASEVAVDIVKHAFITKFNDISADVSPFCTQYCHSLGWGAVSVAAKGRDAHELIMNVIWSWAVDNLRVSKQLYLKLAYFYISTPIPYLG